MQFIYLSFSWPIAKFLGFIVFLIIMMIGFWCLIYMLFIIPYWIIIFLKKDLNQSENLITGFNSNKYKKLYKKIEKIKFIKKNVITKNN